MKPEIQLVRDDLDWQPAPDRIAKIWPVRYRRFQGVFGNGERRSLHSQPHGELRTNMSTAYFIVLNTDDPGFDSFVDGKMLTSNLDTLNENIEELGLKAFEEYASQDLSEYGGPDMEPQWFKAAEGTIWVSKVMRHLHDNADAVPDAQAILEDLDDYMRVFTEAGKRELKWHLELDF